MYPKSIVVRVVLLVFKDFAKVFDVKIFVGEKIFDIRTGLGDFYWA